MVSQTQGTIIDNVCLYRYLKTWRFAHNLHMFVLTVTFSWPFWQCVCLQLLFLKLLEFAIKTTKLSSYLVKRSFIMIPRLNHFWLVLRGKVFLIGSLFDGFQGGSFWLVPRGVFLMGSLFDGFQGGSFWLVPRGVFLMSLKGSK